MERCCWDNNSKGTLMATQNLKKRFSFCCAFAYVRWDNFSVSSGSHIYHKKTAFLRCVCAYVWWDYFRCKKWLFSTVHAHMFVEITFLWAAVVTFVARKRFSPLCVRKWLVRWLLSEPQRSRSRDHSGRENTFFARHLVSPPPRGSGLNPEAVNCCVTPKFCFKSFIPSGPFRLYWKKSLTKFFDLRNQTFFCRLTQRIAALVFHLSGMKFGTSPHIEIEVRW